MVVAPTCVGASTRGPGSLWSAQENYADYERQDRDNQQCLIPTVGHNEYPSIKSSQHFKDCGFGEQQTDRYANKQESKLSFGQRHPYHWDQIMELRLY